ncbi:MAG TPA: PDZ domain-containing protein [Actinomycetota bacterium]|nr:PDZ domain-containing protein [Actinomycetota bacterium]
MSQAPLAATARRVPAQVSVLFVVLLALLSAMLLVPQPALGQTPSPSPGSRPVLGILGFTAPDSQGVAVARVLEDSGADEAGLEPGDIIVDVEGNRVSSMEELSASIGSFNVGDSVTVTYQREGQSRTAEVELGSDRQGRRSPFEAIPQPDFGPGFPDPDTPRRAPGGVNPVSAPDYRPVIILFGLLITGALVALAVILARKNRPAGDSSEAPVPTAAYVPAGADSGKADPLEVLRLRYARGEVTREQFLTMSADLNGSPNRPSGESPTQQL